MRISPELAAVAHAAAKLVAARAGRDYTVRAAAAAHDFYREADAAAELAWAEYQTACDAFAASMAG